MTAPARFEVVREHAATGRMQLHAWDFIVEGAAENEARLMNRLAAEDAGRTWTTGGHLETGWRYFVRSLAPAAPPHANGISTRRPSIEPPKQERVRRSTRNGRP